MATSFPLGGWGVGFVPPGEEAKATQEVASKLIARRPARKVFIISYLHQVRIYALL